MAKPRNRDLETTLQRLFEKERLRSKDDFLKLFCKHLGFEIAEIPLPSRSDEYWGEGQVAGLVEKESFEILAQSGDARLGGFAIIYGTLRDFTLSNQRAIIFQLRNTFRDALYIFAKPQTLGRQEGAQFTIVHARVRSFETETSEATRLILRRFRFGPGERYRTAAERLAKLDLTTLKTGSAIAITALCNQAFDKEALTNEFFKKLDQHIKTIESDLRENERMEGAEAFSEAQLLIERLIFLYFAQNRGWLNQQADYLLENFAVHRAKPKEFTYYAHFLHRLFRTLAEQDWGNRLPGIPFLNGGLFNDDDFRPETSKLKISNATFASLFDDLLEAYNFTVREDTPLSQEVAVDPEMLGKVFESIVLHAESAGEEYQAPDKRKATGSYYTPRIVVHFICRESLRLYFAQRADSLADPAKRDTWNDRVSRLFKEIDPSDGFFDEEMKALKTLLSPSEAARCLECLRAMRTLDPAVGSGAFPVGLLHELVSLQRTFETAAKGYKDPAEGEKTTWLQNTKEHYIQRSLFGVDIQQQAIEICRLRLWLSLLVDYELGVNPFEAERGEFIKAINKISQLPNLEMNFKRGDSLHDYICGHPVRIEPQKPSQYAADLERIEKLGAKLHKTTRGETKKKLRIELLEKRIALARRILEDEIVSLKKGFAASNWFGESLTDREEREKTEMETARLQTALKQLERDGANLQKLEQRQFDKNFYRKLRELEGSEMDGPHNFAWRIDFPHVLSAPADTTLRGEMALVNQAQRQQELTAAQSPKLDGGFDLIVGNPPFVTARNAEKRELYRERWPRVCHMKFLLVCPFFELSFGLLRPDGQLGFIVSNAFAKREFGKPLIEDFFPTVDLEKLVDCSGLMFPGHGTPTCIVFGAQRKSDMKSPLRVAAILPGGGDLRTPPEESPLWHSLEQNHDNSGFSNPQVVVADRERTEMSLWPWNFDSSAESTKLKLELSTARCADFVKSVGVSFFTNADEVFLMLPDEARRQKLPHRFLMLCEVGEEIRDWNSHPNQVVLKPYDEKWKLLKLPEYPELEKWLKLFRKPLGARATFGGPSYDEAGEVWYRYHLINHTKLDSRLISFAFIATHGHFQVECEPKLYKQTAPIVELDGRATETNAFSFAAALNSSSALFWLKQVCFSKRESEESASDTYFEFAGGKVQQLPIPGSVSDALRGKGTALAEALTALSRACWKRGRELPSLALRKLFEKPGEAYHTWNAALPGHVEPHAKLGSPFSTKAELRDRFARAQSIREKLRAEMIARQEEMDWIVYAAYGLLAADDPAAQIETEPAPLDQSQRPFRLWAAAEGDFARAVKLIPADWPKPRRALWEARLAAIRDNEHIRRIEQPVYKRRWDEQWKVGNRWMAGPVAYAQEFIDAFAWWLSEKAEWHLENKSNDRPLALPDWSAAIFKTREVAAAWEVAAGAIFTVETFKHDQLDAEKKETRRAPQRDDSYTAFERFFRDTMLDQSVAHGIPPAVPWNELAAKKKWTPAQLKKAQSVRGKLNVPRERFQQVSPTHFVWAGK